MAKGSWLYCSCIKERLGKHIQGVSRLVDIRFRMVTELWAFFNSRTRPRVNRVTEPAGGWCIQIGGLSFALQALFLPPDSPTQLQTVQFPYHDTSMVCK